MTDIMDHKRITLGVCYYPEHWDKKDWKSDLERMLAHGIETIRIAEFAWSYLERTEGVYDFTFFDEFLDLAYEVGMNVIFCTPTATPPAWLTKKYPEVLNVTMEGVRFEHGFRRHYNYNSKKYIELSKNIVEQSASHYGKHPAIVGWQIDNELNCEVAEFYSPSDTVAFRQFLKEKYGTLDRLNEAWGTVFWNQTYTDWDEVDVPKPTPTNRVNPHRKLDFYRFISDSTCKFAKMQSDIIQKYKKPQDFITTNGIFGNLDSHRLTEESLDFMTYDSYPNFSYCLPLYNKEDPTKDRNWSKHLSEVRSMSHTFGIMEQQSGANGSMEMMAPVPQPGQITLWTMQSVAHGAEFVSYFRWRTATMGTEMYWHGILDYSGRDNRRLQEVGQIHQKLQQISDVAGSEYEAKVAVLRDYDNIWNEQADVWQRELNQASIWGLYQACQHNHTPYDYLYFEHMSVEDMKKYSVIFYPHGSILTKERVQQMEEYVRQGGTLVLGCRTGYKDIHGICVTDYLPGLAAELTGVDIPEYTTISPETGNVTVQWQDTCFPSTLFNDQLEAKEGAKVEAVYQDGYYAGSGALVSHSYGEGTVYYYGSVFTADVAEIFLDKLQVKEPYEEWIELPKDCELAVRKKGDRTYLFVLNFSRQPMSIRLRKKMKNMFTGVEQEGNIKLEGYETVVYQLKP